MSKSQSSSRGRKRSSTFITDTRPSTRTTSTKSTGPYDRAFEQHLIDYGVYPNRYKYPDGRIPPRPANWETIQTRLLRSRASLSPSRFPPEQFERFQDADAEATAEDIVNTTIIPVIEGHLEDARTASGKRRFTNLEPLTDGTLVAGNPDRYYGARPEQLERRIRAQLGKQIVPSTQDDLPVVPNFFLAVKGPDGTAAVAGRQACYDGTLGARGIQALQSYGNAELIYDNNAYTVTASYSDGQLKLYTSHPARPNGPGTRPEYYMHQLNAWSMIGNIDSFRQGATAYRNAADWAKEIRDSFIENANGRRRESIDTSQSLNISSHQEVFSSTEGPGRVESDTSADELAMEQPELANSGKRLRTDSFQSGGK